MVNRVRDYVCPIRGPVIHLGSDMTGLKHSPLKCVRMGREHCQFAPAVCITGTTRPANM